MKRTVSLPEMRQIQLDILIKVDEYCRENGIRYSLGGGTLLGAVRHKGYIPWDDDIDLMMPRPDYERFLDGFDGKYDNLSMQHYRNNSKCCKPFLKISDNRTILIENIQKCGVNIDVFPIDGLPVDGKDIDSFFERFNIEVSKLVRSTNLLGIKRRYVVVLIKQLVKQIIFPSRKKAVERFQKFITTYDFETSQFAASVVGAYGLKEVMETSVFKSYIELPFEGHLFMCIAGYDAYLTKHYGDYMKLPAKEKQVSHHDFEAYWIE